MLDVENQKPMVRHKTDNLKFLMVGRKTTTKIVQGSLGLVNIVNPGLFFY